MSQKSSIKTLPADILARLNFLLSEDAVTLDQVVAWLDEIGHPRSRSAVHRHKQTSEKVAARLRQSREITEAVARELGDSATQGKQGRLLVEMTRAHVFDFLMELEEGALDPQSIAYLGKGLAELGRALRFDQDFELKLRELVARELVAKLDGAVEQAARAGEKGLSTERIAQLRRDFLGVKPQEVIEGKAKEVT